MPQVILQPASGPLPREHYRNTIEKHVQLSEVSSLLSDVDREALELTCRYGRLWVWGVPASKKNDWEKIRRGDFVLFCQGATYVSGHRVEYKTENLALAQHLWPGEVDWPYIYFVTEPKILNIPLSEVNDAANPRYEMKFLQGMIVSNRGLEWFLIPRMSESAEDLNHFGSYETHLWWLEQSDLERQHRDGDSIWAQRYGPGHTDFQYPWDAEPINIGDVIVDSSDGYIIRFGRVIALPGRDDFDDVPRPYELPDDPGFPNGGVAEVHFYDLGEPLHYTDIPVDIRNTEPVFTEKRDPSPGYIFHTSKALSDYLESVYPNLCAIYGYKGGDSEDIDEEAWDEFIEWARLIYEWEQFDETERNYKLEIGNNLQIARTAFLNGADNWQSLLVQAFERPNNLTPWRSHSQFLKLIETHPALFERAIHAIWDDQGDSEPYDFPNAALYMWVGCMHHSDPFLDVLADGIKGTEALNMVEVIASFLMMGINCEHFPIYRATPTNRAYELTHHVPSRPKTTPIYRYYNGMSFLVDLIFQAKKRGLFLRDCLDAQSLVWSITKGDPPESWDKKTKDDFRRYRGDQVEIEDSGSDYTDTPFATIVNHIKEAGIRIDDQTIRRYHSSILAKGFVILSGISGTGKTSLAQEYARAVGGAQLLVPVAPNWTTNEDLLGYQNPLKEEFQHTSFSKFLIEASDEWHMAQNSDDMARPYFLILDEMNLARVEYYFALFLSKLEVMHREGPTNIDLGTQQVKLTPNLKVVGTVNIDETTQMFSDKVFDRSQLIELPVIREEISLLIGDKPYKEDLLRVWDAVKDISPFAYRVVSEIGEYWKRATSLGATSEEALDEQLLQKILPKVRGMDPRVKGSLEEIRTIASDKYPLTFEKADSMITAFVQNGVTSYFS